MACYSSKGFHELRLLAILFLLFPRALTFSVLPLRAAATLLSERSSQSQSSFPMDATSKTTDTDLDPDSLLSVDDNEGSCSPKERIIVDRSTLTLLEHINLNVPSHEHILPFYFELLGCGMDPRKAANLAPSTTQQMTLWANCGASQFHLPYGETAQRIPGEIGLRFDSLESLQRQLELPRLKSSYVAAERGNDPGSGRDYIRITDHYGNVFVCRASANHRKLEDEGGTAAGTSIVGENLRQPIIHPNETEEWGDEVATKYGRQETDCRGIDYVEFHCPKGAAKKIALFYESVLDATTAVVDDAGNTNNGFQIAIVAVGNVDQEGRADQSILFRETTERIPEYDGHHIALYVGETQADFEQAFKNALLTGIVWKNPRFSDQVDSLVEAQKEKQFRFKNIVDMETGETIMELEHEIRSIQHQAWPGREN